MSNFSEYEEGFENDSFGDEFEDESIPDELKVPEFEEGFETFNEYQTFDEGFEKFSGEEYGEQDSMGEFFEEVAEEAYESFNSIARSIENSQGFESMSSEVPLTGFFNQYYTSLSSNLENSAVRFSDYMEQNQHVLADPIAADLLIDQFDPTGEQIFGWVKKKVKKAWKKIKKVAKKGIRLVKTIADKLNITKWIARKLRKFIRPFLKRIIGRVLRYVPRKYRGLARRALRRFGIPGEVESNFTENYLGEGINVDDISEDFSNQLESFSNYETFEGQVPSMQEGNSNMQIQSAINEFAQKLSQDGTNNLQENTEQFVTAVLTGLRWGIRIIGRKRTIKFLAGQLAKLLRRWIPKKMAHPISLAVVKGGFRLLNLEVPEGDTNEERIAGLSANIVIQAAEKLQRIDDSSLDNEVMVSAITNESIASNLADQFVTN